jgi:5-methyltetrahydrofolate--homocysteine methyltransferase
MLDFSHLERPFILDGATGTRLQMLGLPQGVLPARWILDHPETIRTVQRSYAEAGSVAVFAPTFCTTRADLKKYGERGSVRDMNRQLVELSREAAPGLFVGGDMAPAGLPLPPMGDTSFDELLDVYTEQAAALEEAGVDFFAVETQMSLLEARAALAAIRSVSDKPAAVSFSCGGSGRTLYGGDLAAILLVLQGMGAAAFGINCCGELPVVERALRRMQPLAAVPLIAKPNAGLPVTENGRMEYRMPPGELAAAAPGFLAAGAALLGGCCGTDERHIAALAKAVEGLSVPAPASPKGEFYATESRYVEYSGKTAVAELPVTEDLEEDAEDAGDKGAEMLCLTLENKEQAEIVLECQGTLKLPLCLRCPDEELRAYFLRAYNGKPKII